MRPHPKRTRTNPRSPRGWGTCDRSGFIANLEDLVWQWDWRGTTLVNLRILVAPDMVDKPQRQLGTLVLPPDPVGITNARPEQYAMEEGAAQVPAPLLVFPDGTVVVNPAGTVITGDSPGGVSG